MKRALSIKALLEWAYSIERVGASGGAVGLLEAERRAAGYAVSARSMTGALADQAALGARVAGGGSLNYCHDDAELVERVVSRALTPAPRTLVVLSAETCSHPDWRPDARHRLEPVKVYAHAATARWRPEVITSQPGKRGAVAAYCPIVERDAPDAVAADRSRYTAWRAALVWLRAQPGLTDGLRKHVLTDELPPDRPWLAISSLTRK